MLRVETSKTLYAPGDTVELILTNQGDAPLAYNICFGTRLERQTGASWVAIPDPPNQPPCTADLSSLLPAQQASGRFALRSDLNPGSYRYHLESVLRSNPDAVLPYTERISNTFEVRAKS